MRLTSFPDHFMIKVFMKSEMSVTDVNVRSYYMSTIAIL